MRLRPQASSEALLRCARTERDSHPSAAAVPHLCPLNSSLCVYWHGAGGMEPPTYLPPSPAWPLLPLPPTEIDADCPSLSTWDYSSDAAAVDSGSHALLPPCIDPPSLKLAAPPVPPSPTPNALPHVHVTHGDFMEAPLGLQAERGEPILTCPSSVFHLTQAAGPSAGMTLPSLPPIEHAAGWGPTLDTAAALHGEQAFTAAAASPAPAPPSSRKRARSKSSTNRVRPPRAASSSPAMPRSRRARAPLPPRSVSTRKLVADAAAALTADIVLKVGDAARVAAHIHAASRIAVVVGAGISVSAGIPDFRSPGTGLYSIIEAAGGAHELTEPQEIFDFNLFKASPDVFYRFAHLICTDLSRIHPSLTHHFLAALHASGKLLRVYTQNVDGLERRVGLPYASVVQCHGTMETVRCMRCRVGFPSSIIAPAVRERRVARCPRAECEKSRNGVLKPDIVFFKELLPNSYIHAFYADIAAADLVIVIGSSLKVAPVADVCKLARAAGVPSILINRQRLFQHRFALTMIADADAACQALWQTLGWPGLDAATAALADVAAMREADGAAEEMEVRAVEDAGASAAAAEPASPGVSRSGRAIKRPRGYEEHDCD